MATLRQDPTTNEWVILAPQRDVRPVSSSIAREAGFDRECPFCPGNEHLTPPEILRTPGDDAWDQRVVPNRYPALEAGGSTQRHGDRVAREMAGVGYHEVVIESPRHDDRLDEMAAERLGTVLRLWRERYRTLRQDPEVRSVVVFKNFGERAGSSLVHPHSQILATPVLPPDTLHRFAVATRYFDDTGRCVYLDLLARERKERERIVAQTDGFVAVAPFASGVPFETWVMPVEHQTSFDRLADERIPELASLLRSVLGALRSGAGDPDYNLVVQSAPVLEEAKPFFLWHLQLLPRMATAAGFELATGMCINTVPPEHAAQVLRGAPQPVPLG